MCGINVLYDPRHRLSELSGLVQLMNAEMIYRGPDGAGYFTDDQIAMGMRRLSIIDISGGQQPLCSEDSSIVLICNGEIYNYVELRRDLIAKGHRFSTQSDCEVIVHLYEDLDVRCLSKLRGMFAFALWDRNKRVLFAARDRVGIKPLYFAIQDSVLLLSSELKAILKTGLIRPTLDPRAVWQYLHYGFPIDQRQTVLKEIGRVRPGEYVVADESGVQWNRYWQPLFAGEGESGASIGIKDARRLVLNVLGDSVKLHLRSDVPVAVMLSSGIDSSTIAALSRRNELAPTALCAGYAGQHTCDERDLAHLTAASLCLPYKDVILDERLFARYFYELSKVVDEPVADVAAIPQWAIYDQASHLGYKVLLSGIGGDELFFGYPLWNSVGEKIQLRSALRKALPSWSFHISSWLADSAAASLARIVGRGEMRFRRISDWLSPDGYTGLDMHSNYYLSGAYLKRCGTPDFVAVGIDSDQPLLQFQTLATRGPDQAYAMLFASWLPHNSCYFADKLGMGKSVEVRVPFLDHVLIESVQSLPFHLRYNRQEPKALLRETMRGILSDKVLNKTKQGFAPPNAFVRNLVHESKEVILFGKVCNTWLSRARIADLFSIPEASAFLYKLLVFEHWFSLVCALARAPVEPCL